MHENVRHLQGDSLTCSEKLTNEMTSARNSCATLPRPATTSIPTSISLRIMSYPIDADSETPTRNASTS